MKSKHAEDYEAGLGGIRKTWDIMLKRTEERGSLSSDACPFGTAELNILWPECTHFHERIKDLWDRFKRAYTGLQAATSADNSPRDTGSHDGDGHSFQPSNASPSCGEKHRGSLSISNLVRSLQEAALESGSLESLTVEERRSLLYALGNLQHLLLNTSSIAQVSEIATM